MAPGSMPAGSRELVQEGLVIPPVRLVAGGEPVRDVLRPAAGQHAHPDRARGRPARPARRPPPGRAPPGRGGRAPRRRRACARPSTTCSTTPSAAPGPRSPRMPDGRYEAAGGPGGRRRRPPSDLWIRVAVTIAGDRMTVDFTGTDPDRARQLQLPAGRDALGRLLRGALRHRPRHPRLGGRLRPGGGDRARGHPGQRHPPRPPSPGATSRPPAASWTPSSPRSGGRWRCPPRARGR